MILSSSPLYFRYGAKLFFGLCNFIPAVLTLLMPFACETHFGMALVLRALIGLFAAAAFPCTYNFFYKWVAPIEKV